MKRRLSTNSMRFRIAAAVSGIVALLLALLFGSNLYAIRVIREQVYETYRTTLNIYMDGLERELHDVEFFLAGLTADSADLHQIREQGPSWSLAAVRAQRKLSQSIPSYSTMDGLFIYEPHSGVWIDSTNTGATNQRRLAVRDALMPLLDGGAAQDGKGSWLALRVGEEYILYRVLTIQGCAVGAWVGTGRLTGGFNVESYSNIGYVFFSDDAGTPLTGEPALAQLALHPAEGARHYQLAGTGGRWMMVARGNAKGNLYMVLLVRDNSILEGLDSFTRLLVLLVVCAAALVALLIYAMRRLLVRPLAKLTAARRALQAGDWGAHVSEKGTVDEFTEVNTVFNHMVGQLEGMKIGLYEQELEKQRIEMQMLKQQLAPHTFVNCLNTIHGLAAVGENDLVQQMAVDLSRHIRYTLSASQVVQLSQELEHVRNYVVLSAIRFRGSIQLEEEVAPATLDACVPPLLLQTFVENTIKYEVVPGEVTCIHIETHREEGTLHVRLWDTGEGYAPEVLARLARPAMPPGSFTGEGIGLPNLRQRLLLLYGEENVGLTFSNRPGAGAQMDIAIPYITEWGNAHDTDSAGG